jgi:hypothetical protein
MSGKNVKSSKVIERGFEPRFRVGMNSDAKSFVEHVRSAQPEKLALAASRGNDLAKTALYSISRTNSDPCMHLLTIMQTMQALALAVPRYYVIECSSGHNVLTRDGCEWVRKTEEDLLSTVDALLPGSFFAKSRSKKDASK